MILTKRFMRRFMLSFFFSITIFNGNSLHGIPDLKAMYNRISVLWNNSFSQAWIDYMYGFLPVSLAVIEAGKFELKQHINKTKEELQSFSKAEHKKLVNKAQEIEKTIIKKEGDCNELLDAIRSILASLNARFMQEQEKISSMTFSNNSQRGIGAHVSE